MQRGVQHCPGTSPAKREGCAMKCIAHAFGEFVALAKDWKKVGVCSAKVQSGNGPRG